jgi:hypothetical protein
VPWLTGFSPASGTGNATISFTVASYSGSTARVGHITVQGAGGNVQLTVTQSPPSPCSYALNPPTRTVPAAG